MTTEKSTIPALAEDLERAVNAKLAAQDSLGKAIDTLAGARKNLATQRAKLRDATAAMFTALGRAPRKRKVKATESGKS